MGQARKQRLVGGVVLLALAVIIVPMLLDFSRERPSEIESLKIPPSPDVMKMEVLPLDVRSEKIDPEVDTENGIIETPTPEKKPVASAGTSGSSSEPVAKPKAKSRSGTKKPTASGASAWVVQAASLGAESKALKLRDRLRDAGFSAFVERATKPNGDVVYRVRVGPVLVRSEANKLKDEVKQEIKLDGLVMKYR